MSFPVSIILTILKSIVSNEVQSELANELIGISMDGLSEISVNKLSEFIEIQKSKIEHILSKENLKSIGVSEYRIEYVIAEIKDLFLKTEITDEVFEQCRYSEEKLTEFLWSEYRKHKRYIEYGSDIKKGLYVVAKELISVRCESETFEKEMLIQISNSVDDTKKELKKISDYMVDRFSKLEEKNQTIYNKISESSDVYKNTQQKVKSRTEEYVDKWNDNMFLNNFDKRDENAGINVKLKDVYLESHLPHYLWKKNSKPMDDLKDLLHEYINGDIDNKMLLILGQPGIGKSTLITWIAANFANSLDNILVYQFASDLKHMDWQNISNNYDITDEILNAVNLSYDDLEGKTLIIDGFDEISAGSNRAEILNLLYRKLIKEHAVSKFSLIVTCRENYIQDLYKIECNYITLQAWNTKQIESFCAVYYEKTYGSIDRNALDSIIKKKEILGIPLILYMILALNIEIGKESSIVDVYDQIFSLEGGIYYRCIMNTKYASFHWIREIGEAIHLMSKGIAIWMFENCPEEASIPKSEYEKICSSVMQEQKIERKEIKQNFLIGNFFKLVKYCEGIGTERLYFVHRSIYEYFVAKTIYDLIEKDMMHLTDESQVNLIKGMPIYLKEGKLTPTIGEYMQYKIIKFYDNLEEKSKEKFYQWWEDAIGIMMKNGVFFYSQRNLLDYATIINKEMICFLNLIRMLRLLLPMGRKKHIVESINRNEIERYIKHLSVEYEMTKFIKSEFVDLSKMDLYEISLKGIYLRGAILRDVDLRGAYLRDAYLVGADLRGAKLNGIDLKNANLKNAKLNGADLRGAKLEGSNFSMTYLIGADLRGADITEIELVEADLSNALIDEEQAYYLSKRLKVCELKYTMVFIKDTKDMIGYDEYSRGKRYSNSLEERRFLS